MPERVSVQWMDNRIRDRVLRRIREWLGIPSPSEAFVNALNGTATEKELQLLASSTQQLGKIMSEAEPWERELLEMQSDWNHPSWDA